MTTLSDNNLQDSQYLDKNFRGNLLIDIIYLESKLKQFLDIIFNDDHKDIKVSIQEILEKETPGNSSGESNFINYNAKQFKRNKKYILGAIEEHKSSGNILDEFSMSKIAALIQLISFNFAIQNKIKISNKDFKKYKQLLDVISKMRNILAHPPRMPEIDFELFLHNSRVQKTQKNNYFYSKKQTLSTIKNIDDFFSEVINKLLKK